MERIIKFRGKRVDNGEWIEGTLSYMFNNNEMTYIMPNCYFATRDFGEFDENENPIISDSETALGGFIKVIPETVGQLWVINHDFEVYTDDLFTAICSPSGSNNKKERICKVGFDGSGMKAVVWHKKEWWHYSSMNFATIKIIGNIHDNAELLK